MDKLNELKALADLAQQLEDNGHFVEANTVHNKFIRLAQQSKGTYTVQGDIESLEDIAAMKGVSVMQLKGYNPGIKNILYKGQTVKLPPAPRKEAPGTYVVSQGDSLSKIAGQKGVSLNMLLKLNPGIDPKAVLQPGTVLKVPVVKSSLDSEEYPEMPIA
jgi:LysM repeat protein